MVCFNSSEFVGNFDSNVPTDIQFFGKVLTRYQVSQKLPLFASQDMFLVCTLLDLRSSEWVYKNSLSCCKITHLFLKLESTGFSNLEEMKWNLSKGVIGRVLVDRNTAFHFLDKSGLKRNRQIRLIRYIDYPMYYYLAHVNKGVLPAPSLSSNDTNDSDTELVQRKTQIAECGPKLKEDSTKLVSESKETARNQLIPAELQVISDLKPC